MVSRLNAGATPTTSLLRRLRAILMDRVSPQRVVFHHVPKCGGTSVGAALRWRYILSQATVTPESSFQAFAAFTGRSDRDQMLIDVLDLREQMLLYWLFEDIRCVSLHVRFNEIAFERFHDRYKFITILRDPVSRFLSHYFWSNGRDAGHARINEDLEPFLDTPRARRMGATYVEYFSGAPKETDLSCASAIQSAIANLSQFDVVGRLDDLTLFEASLGRELGVRIRIGHHNEMSHLRRSERDLLSPDLFQRVEEVCAPDIAIWSAVFH